jgi:hypothetical protein
VLAQNLDSPQMDKKYFFFSNIVITHKYDLLNNLKSNYFFLNSPIKNKWKRNLMFRENVGVENKKELLQTFDCNDFSSG